MEGRRRCHVLFNKRWHLLPPFLSYEPGTDSIIQLENHCHWEQKRGESHWLLGRKIEDDVYIK
jgi:hypothetical protein